ncbi:MAG TPA: hypothetical protein VK797_03140 [Tepidisphaeraceae bacterium]|nr:hypothetical protein [Tepidisphaeraceae bacterium]
MLTSWTQLAAAMGRGKSSVLRASKRPDWPYKLPVPAAEVQNAKDWCRINIVPSGAETPIGNPKRDLELRLLSVKIEKLENDLRQQNALYVLRAEVEQENVRKVLAVRNELMNTPRLMAMLAPCTDDLDREAKIRMAERHLQPVRRQRRVTRRSNHDR